MNLKEENTEVVSGCLWKCEFSQLGHNAHGHRGLFSSRNSTPGTHVQNINNLIFLGAVSVYVEPLLADWLMSGGRDSSTFKGCSLNYLANSQDQVLASSFASLIISIGIR